MDKKTIIIGDIRFPEHNWIFEQIKGEYLLFYVEHAVISNPYGCTIRNVISTLVNQNIDEIVVIGINEGSSKTINEKIDDFFEKENIGFETRQTVEYILKSSQSGFSFTDWIAGMSSKEENIKKSVNLLRRHPIIPKRLKVSGYLAKETKQDMKKIV